MRWLRRPAEKVEQQRPECPDQKQYERGVLGQLRCRPELDAVVGVNREMQLGIRHGNPRVVGERRVEVDAAAVDHIRSAEKRWRERAQSHAERSVAAL